MRRQLKSIIILTVIGMLASLSSYASQCPPENGIALQVLGSGGPIADDGRASTGYLVWVDEKPRVLIDAGGGTFLRFAQAGAQFQDLDFIGLSHFHTDHSADFSALMKSGSFSDRKRSISISGPGGDAPFPGINDFLHSMFDRDEGAYGYLSGYLDGDERYPELDVIEISRDELNTVKVFENEMESLRISAIHVPHGIVPALAFKVISGKNSIVFASDQNGSNDRFIDFARDATVLVMHMPIPEGTSGAGRKLHAPPSVIGKTARQANVKMLVLSHFMKRSLRQLELNIEIVRSEYEGTIKLADDLICYGIDEDG